MFVLLVYFAWLYKSPINVSMKRYNGQVIDINETASNLRDLCFNLLPAHALSGCDSVSYPYAKWMIYMCNLLFKGSVPLRAFIGANTLEEDWTGEGCQFLSYLYGGIDETSLDGLRYLLFSRMKDPTKI